MKTTEDYRLTLCQRLRMFDVELSEDLLRRLPVCTDVSTLSMCFQQLLAQYPNQTLTARTTIDDSVTFEVWYANFLSNILPILKRHRLPPCTDQNSIPVYQGVSRSS